MFCTLCHPSYLPLATTLQVQKDNTINYVEKAIIDFEATLKHPSNVKLGASTALFMSHRLNLSSSSLHTNGQRYNQTCKSDHHTNNRHEQQPMQGQDTHRHPHGNQDQCQPHKDQCSHSQSKDHNSHSKNSNRLSSNAAHCTNFTKNHYCTHCKQQGHNFDNCHTHHRKDKANTISTITSDSTSNKEWAFMVTSATTQGSKHSSSKHNVWYLDTGASQHFTCNHNFYKILSWYMTPQSSSATTAHSTSMAMVPSPLQSSSMAMRWR